MLARVFQLGQARIAEANGHVAGRAHHSDRGVTPSAVRSNLTVTEVARTFRHRFGAVGLQTRFGGCLTSAHRSLRLNRTSLALRLDGRGQIVAGEDVIHVLNVEHAAQRVQRVEVHTLRFPVRFHQSHGGRDGEVAATRLHQGVGVFQFPLGHELRKFQSHEQHDTNVTTETPRRKSAISVALVRYRYYPSVTVIPLPRR